MQDMAKKYVDIHFWLTRLAFSVISVKWNTTPDDDSGEIWVSSFVAIVLGGYFLIDNKINFQSTPDINKT